VVGASVRIGAARRHGHLRFFKKFFITAKGHPRKVPITSSRQHYLLSADSTRKSMFVGCPAKIGGDGHVDPSGGELEFQQTGGVGHRT